MRPHIIIHTAMSLDGRTDRFLGDVNLYYEVAAKLNPDATLTGSNTLLKAGLSPRRAFGAVAGERGGWAVAGGDGQSRKDMHLEATAEPTILGQGPRPLLREHPDRVYVILGKGKGRCH